MSFTNEMDFENRIVAPEFSGEDGDVEYSLRPKTLNEYIGQEKAKENLSVFIEAARRRGGGTGPCAAPRPARFGQDHPLQYHRQRDECQHPGDLRPRH